MCTPLGSVSARLTCPMLSEELPPFEQLKATVLPSSATAASAVILMEFRIISVPSRNCSRGFWKFGERLADEDGAAGPGRSNKQAARHRYEGAGDFVVIPPLATDRSKAARLCRASHI